MSNMSYCRWENTASALSDCLNAIEDEDDGYQALFEGLSSYEQNGMMDILGMAKKICAELEDEDPIWTWKADE